jgi:transposase
MIMVIKRCKLSRKIQVQLLQFFVAGVTARTAAELVGVSRPITTLYYSAPIAF